MSFPMRSRKVQVFWTGDGPAKILLPGNGSSGDILQELQSRFPGCYERSHLRTLQRGIRKIRAQVLKGHDEAGSPQEPEGNLLSSADLKTTKPEPEGLTSSSTPVCDGTHAPDSTHTCSSDRPPAEELSSHTGRRTRRSIAAAMTSSKREPGQIVRHPPTVSSPSASHPTSLDKGQRLTIERAIQEYLRAHRTVGHRPKTLEWHQMALCHLQRYLLTECHLLLINQLTETTMRSWLVFLSQTPIRRGLQRSASTIETYARSARAFCNWLVERGTLSCSPLSERAFPQTSVPPPRFVSPATFEQMMRASFSRKTKAHWAERMAQRDQALLWVLFDTGITVSELCALRLADLDQHTGRLACERERRQRAPDASRVHLPKPPAFVSEAGGADNHAGGDPLFGSQGKQQLTRNGVTMMFARFRTRAGISEEAISPQILRHSFALRYLRAGGNPQGLQESMGYEGMALIRQYLRWYDQLLHEQMQKGTEEV